MIRIQKLDTNKPDFVVRHGDGTVYMHRWWMIPKNRFFNIYLHHFLDSDEDRALHDHPWWSLGMIISKGGIYTEHLPHGVTKLRKRFQPVLRSSTWAHRIELTHGTCWTIFITGPKIREWGFHCPKGWKPWEKFVSKTADGNSVGEGCND